MNFIDRLMEDLTNLNIDFSTNGTSLKLQAYDKKNMIWVEAHYKGAYYGLEDLRGYPYSLMATNNYDELLLYILRTACEKR